MSHAFRAINISLNSVGDREMLISNFTVHFHISYIFKISDHMNRQVTCNTILQWIRYNTQMTFFTSYACGKRAKQNCLEEAKQSPKQYYLPSSDWAKKDLGSTVFEKKFLSKFRIFCLPWNWRRYSVAFFNTLVISHFLNVYGNTVLTQKIMLKTMSRIFAHCGPQPTAILDHFLFTERVQKIY